MPARSAAGVVAVAGDDPGDVRAVAVVVVGRGAAVDEVHEGGDTLAVRAARPRPSVVSRSGRRASAVTPESMTATPTPCAVEAHRCLHGARADGHRDAVQMRDDGPVLVDALDLGAPGQRAGAAAFGSSTTAPSISSSRRRRTPPKRRPSVGSVPGLRTTMTREVPDVPIGPCAQRAIELVVGPRGPRLARSGLASDRRGQPQKADQQGGYPPPSSSSLSKTCRPSSLRPSGFPEVGTILQPVTRSSVSGGGLKLSSSSGA